VSGVTKKRVKLSKLRLQNLKLGQVIFCHNKAKAFRRIKINGTPPNRTLAVQAPQIKQR
jgi:hypothetical protein